MVISQKQIWFPQFFVYYFIETFFNYIILVFQKISVFSEITDVHEKKNLFFSLIFIKKVHF